MHSTRKGSRQIEHIGSAHTDEDVEVLKAAAGQRLVAGLGELDLDLEVPASGSVLPITTTQKNRTGVILYWRPIVPGWNDDPATMAGVLDTGRHADAIVFTGYHHKPENTQYLRDQGVTVPFDDDYARRKVMPHDLDARVVAAWQASGISTPLFRKTSCGVAFAHAAPDYNGHWGVRELCDICPQAQQQRCDDDHRRPTAADLDAVLTHLNYESHYVIDDGHVWTHGLGEQKRYAVQHTLRHQIWELDQPHHLHAHGRSLLGHTTDLAETERLGRIREDFETAAR